MLALCLLARLSSDLEDAGALRMHLSASNDATAKRAGALLIVSFVAARLTEFVSKKQKSESLSELSPD